MKHLMSRFFCRHTPVRLLAIGMLAGAAAAVPGHTAAATLVPEAAVRQRASERWQALIAGKFEDAYAMLAPGVRAIDPFQSYRSRFGTNVTWTDAEVARVSCNEAQDRCAATVRIDSRAFLPGFMNTPVSTFVEESWIKEQGNWWFFPRS